MPGGNKRSYTYTSINQHLLSTGLLKYYELSLPAVIKRLTKNKL